MECRRCLRARIERYRTQFAKKLGVTTEDATVKVETNKLVENEPTRRVLRYYLPDGRMRYCDPMAAATTMGLPDPPLGGGGGGGDG